MKKTSIQNRIVQLSMLIVIVIVPLLLIIAFSEISSYNVTSALNRNDMQKMTSLASNYIKADFEIYTALAESAGCNAELASPDISDEEKLKIMTRLSKQYGAKRGNIVRKDGFEITQGKDFSDREYFINAMQGKSSIYEPTISRLTGEVIEIVAAPLWKDGKYGTEPVGCAYFITQPEYINDILRELNISENCYAFILDSTGRVIGHSDSTKVLSDDALDPAVQSVCDKMLMGESGTSNYNDSEMGRMVVSYAPIPETNGWSLAVCAKEKDFLGPLYTAMAVMILMLFIVVIISYFLTKNISKRISGPIRNCTEVLSQVRNGNLDLDVPQVKTNDETKILADTTSALISNFKAMIQDIRYMLSEMAVGNFKVSSENEDVYCGEFEAVLDAVNGIKKQLSNTLQQINRSSNVVSTGAELSAHSAEGLSATSEEQAAAFEECNSSMHIITEKVSDTAQNCEAGREIVAQTSMYTETVVNNMTNLQNAMSEIEVVSQKIDGIVKTIEDIAFQTNILALNATIEAARAGEAGKGFSVVSDEVRNLAVQSSEAAKNAAELIHKTLSAVENGSAITHETYASVDGVKGQMEKVSVTMQNIANAAKEQSDMITRINQTFDGISNSIRISASSAEEGAETAHNMSEEAETLKKLVDRFQF